MDPIFKCAKCNKEISRAVPTHCVGCDLPYHPGCAIQLPTIPDGSFARCCRPGSTSPINSQGSQSSNNIDSVMRAINALTRNVSENFTTMTENFSDINTKLDDTLSRLTNMEGRIVGLSNRMSAVEGRLEKCETTLSEKVDHKSDTNICINEVIDRNERKKNLVLFGLHENENVNEDPLNTDAHNNNFKTLVTNKLKNFTKTKDLERCRIFRIGSNAQVPQKPRPVKIVCASEEKAQQILRTFILVKRDPTRSSEVKTLSLTRDKTPMQREEIRVLQEQLTVRRLEGETNIAMGYRRGVPTIIKIPPRKRTTTITLQVGGPSTYQP